MIKRLKYALKGREMEKCTMVNESVLEVLYASKNGQKTLFCNETKSIYIYDRDVIETIIPFNMIKDYMEVIDVLEGD